MPRERSSRTERPPGRVAAIRTAVRAYSERLARRADVERERHSSVDVVFDLVDQDSEVGGDIMAGALAYRLFIWLLPAALVAVAGLGIASQAESLSPQAEAHRLGLAGLVSSSVATAAKSSARWYALLIGIPLVIYTTRSLLRTLIATHRLVWRDDRRAIAKPTISATLLLLAALLSLLATSVLAAAARQSSSISGISAALLLAIPCAAIWLLVSLRLPHHEARWRDLVPGALLFGVGIEALHLVTVYFIAPQASSKQSTYGSLGVAAALLLGLFLLSRLVVTAAVLNATLVNRRLRPDPPTPGEPTGASE